MDKLTVEDVIAALKPLSPSNVEDGITFIHGIHSALYGTLEALNGVLCPEGQRLPAGASLEGIDETSRKVILIHWLAGSTWLACPWSPSTPTINFKTFFSSMLAVYWRRLCYGKDFETPDAGLDRMAEVIYFTSQVGAMLLASGNGYSTEQCDSLSEKLSENFARAANDTMVEFRKTAPSKPYFNAEWN